jgi:phosphatidyl-myo-inositol dimannoside synthase
MSVHDASSSSSNDLDKVKPLSILLITNDFGPRSGGIETFVIGLLQRLPYGSSVIYTSNQGDTEEYDQQWRDAFGVEIIRDRAKILLPTPRVAKAVKKLLANYPIDRIWYGAAAPLALLNPALKKAARKLGHNNQLRTLALTHGHEIWWAKIPPFSWALKIIGRSLDQLGYITEYTRGEIAQGLAKKDRKKLIHLPPGIDTNIFQPTPDTELENNFRRENNIQGKKLIISVGRLVHRKGQDRLIESMPTILQAVPDAHLLLVGKGPYKSKLEKLVAKLELSDAVTFLGRIELSDLPKYLSMASIFAAPSRDRLGGLEVEGLGIVYLEASSCALAVVVGDSGGAREALIDGKTGILVDGKSVAQISQAVIKLLIDPSLRDEMGRNGQGWVKDLWSWDRLAARFEAALLH